MQRLAVAKTALTAEFPRYNSNVNVSQVFKTIDQAISVCSNKNVKLCRQLLFATGESGRYFELLLNYMTALSQTVPRPRRRLYLLYVLNDMMFEAKFRMTSASSSLVQHNFLQAVNSSIEELVVLAFECRSNRSRIRNLTEIWREKHYLDPEVFLLVNNTRNLTRRAEGSIETNTAGQVSKALDATIPKYSSSNNSRQDTKFSAFIGDPHWEPHEQPASLFLLAMGNSSPQTINLNSVTASRNPPLSEEVEVALDRFYQGLDWGGGPFYEFGDSDEDKQLWTYEGWTREFYNKFESRLSRDRQNRAASNTIEQPQSKRAFAPPANY